MVDDEDYEMLNKFNWCVNINRNTEYARRTSIASGGKHIEVKMHSIIMSAPMGMQVDHIDGNGLNNQRYNLRLVTTRQNCMNRHHSKTSKYPGVTWDKRDMCWIAKARIDGKCIRIGGFKSEELAHNAYSKRVTPIEHALISKVLQRPSYEKVIGVELK